MLDFGRFWLIVITIASVISGLVLFIVYIGIFYIAVLFLVFVGITILYTAYYALTGKDPASKFGRK